MECEIGRRGHTDTQPLVLSTDEDGRNPIAPDEQ